jgi:type IV pilus assembly protein PilW
MTRIPPALRIVRRAGFSLIELMVATTLTLVVVLLLGALFTNNSMARREIDGSGQQIENGRYAMELLRDDVRLAGYYGEFISPWGGVNWQLPANPCDATLANLGWNAANLNVPVPVSGFEGHDPALDVLSTQCITNRVPGSDVLVVRRTSTAAAAPPPASPSVPYLQVSLQSWKCTSAEASFVLAASGSPSPFTLHQKDCATASQVRQYLVHVYYVASCDDCGSNDGIPTLKRVDLGAGTMNAISLAQGIADMRVEYGLDTGSDGFPDEYRKCGASSAYTGPCTAADWANVMAVKVYLLTRNMEPTPGYVDRKTYTMGMAGVLPAFSGAEAGYKHHVYEAPIRVIGQSDLRELP